MLRRVMEKTASFHGYAKLGRVHQARRRRLGRDVFTRELINLLSHGDYSLYEPREMMDGEQGRTSARLLTQFIETLHPFNPELFPS